MRAPPTRRTCEGRRKNGQPCRGLAVAGSATCRMHNGHRAGAPIVHGRYATSLKGRVQVAYLASLADPSLLDVEQTIAAMDAIAKAQAERIEEADGAGFRMEAARLVRKCREAAASDPAEAREAINRLFRWIEDGWSRAKAEREFFDLAERVDRRVSEAAKVRHAKENAIPAQKLTELMVAWISAVERLAAPDLAKQIVAEIQRSVGVDPVPPNRIAGMVN